jgi:RNA polymerase sigma-70 factor (ECF subfamily)
LDWSNLAQIEPIESACGLTFQFTQFSMTTLTIDSPIEPEYSCADGDLSLVQACLQGNTRSFQQLYRRHQAKVRSTLYQLCGADGIDDLVQEVFLRAWKGLSKFRQTAQFSTWLYRITWNVACDRRKILAQNRQRYTDMAETSWHNVVDETANPDLTAMHYRDLVAKGLAQLSLEHRSVLVLHDLQELPQKEISIALGIPVGTVKSRLFYARSQLRQFLTSQGIEL